MLQGQAFGASSPITGATVNVWETDPTSSGYPSAANEKAKILATTTTGDGTTTINGKIPAAGAWSISSSYTCDAPTGNTAGPFLYVTVTGGNTGAGVNNQSVLIAPLGACSAVLPIASTLHLNINESSTIAAAYALGNFTYVDNTNPGSQKVYIGAPANNNALAGSCTGTGANMSCVAAGLLHAFNNAYNLGGYVGIGTASAGQAGKTIPANPFFSGSTANANAIVPQAELNTLANILATCVNSTGGTTTGPCGSLFALTTTANGTLPVDTLTAAINIAQNPAHNVGSATASGLFQLASTSGPFQPTLTTYPQNWSVAIFYPGTTTSFSEPQAVALDANDNAYVTAVVNPASGGNPSNGSVTAFSSAGSQLWTTGNNTTICAPGSVATDTLGNVWIANYSSTTYCSTGTYGLYSFPQASTGSSVAIGTSLTNASTANIQSAPFAIAVDRFNNLWYGRRTSTCSTASGTGANVSPVCVAEVPYLAPNTYGAATNLQTFAAAPALSNIDYIVPDANQNIWVGGYQPATFTPIGVIPNTGTPGAPAYGTGVTAAALGSAPQGMVAIDASGNAWSSGPGNATSLNQQLYYTVSGTTLSAANTPTFGNASISASKPQGAEFDGAGRLFFASQSSSGQIWFFSPTAGANSSSYTSSTTAANLVPCYLPTSSATTCVATSSTYPGGYPRSLQIDSTGSLWYAAPAVSSFGAASATTTGSLVQIIGTAAPTWPQLSYAKFGVMPQ